MQRDADDTPHLYIDGAVHASLPNTAAGFMSYGLVADFHIYQPKMPPIPEDACIIADYMLMADTVHRPDNDGTDVHIKIHKGIRRVSASRDIFYNGSATINYGQHTSYGSAHGHRVFQTNTDASKLIRLPYFGTGATYSGQLDGAYHNNALFKINGTAVTTSSTGTNHSGTQVLYQHTSGTNSLSSDNNGTFTMNGSGEGYAGVTGINLGTNEVEVTADATSNYYIVTFGFDIQTPIHTSSHYQTFETPYIKELVGGDRNMEQTNLVVTPDGKTWDEVTRDTSYLGKVCILGDASADQAAGFGFLKLTEIRGSGQAVPMGYVQKDIALAYDRLIILEDGEYFMQMQALSSGNGWGQGRLWVNGTVMIVTENYSSGTVRANLNCQISLNLVRGDYVQFDGQYIEAGDDYRHHFEIQRLN